MSTERDRLLAEGPRIAPEPGVAGRSSTDGGAEPSGRGPRPGSDGFTRRITRYVGVLVFGSVLAAQALPGHWGGLVVAVAWAGALGIALTRLQRRRS